jgi:hypothetical protein
MIDWPSYNQSLVRRGQVLLDYDVLDGWDHELSQMNKICSAPDWSIYDVAFDDLFPSVMPC